MTVRRAASLRAGHALERQVGRQQHAVAAEHRDARALGGARRVDAGRPAELARVVVGPHRRAAAAAASTGATVSATGICGARRRRARRVRARRGRAVDRDLEVRRIASPALAAACEPVGIVAGAAAAAVHLRSTAARRHRQRVDSAARARAGSVERQRHRRRGARTCEAERLAARGDQRDPLAVEARRAARHRIAAPEPRVDSPTICSIGARVRRGLHAGAERTRDDRAQRGAALHRCGSRLPHGACASTVLRRREPRRSSPSRRTGTRIQPRTITSCASSRRRGACCGSTRSQRARRSCRARATSARSSASSREFARGPVNVENDLWVVTPLVLPLPHSAVARAINRQVLRAHDPRAAPAARHRPVPAVDVPAERRATTSARSARSSRSTTASTSGRCSATSTATQTVAAERALLGKVDAVFAINVALAEAKRALNRAHVRVAARRRSRAVRARARCRDGRCRPTSPRCRARASASTARCATGSTSS